MARGIKFSGIVFRKDDESGIAKITIVNTTQAEDVIRDELVDLYTADQDYTSGEYEPFVFWTLLDPAEDSYSVSVTHSGDHHPDAGGAYHIQVDGYLTNEELLDGEVETKVIAWHSDHDVPVYEYTLTPDTNHSSYKYAYFNGDSSTGAFAIDYLLHIADAPVRFSKDGGTTWLYPNSYQLTWGSNSPTYDDETVGSNGAYGVNFDTPPDAGSNNVIFEYRPKVDKYIVETTIRQPSDGSTFKDYRANVRLMDHGIETT